MTRSFLLWLQQLIRGGDVHPFYISSEWRAARAAAIKEHHGECYRCKHIKTPSELTPAYMVHHVKPLKKYPQYALSLYVDGEIQLMPLCHDCHAAVESAQKSAADLYPERW